MQYFIIYPNTKREDLHLDTYLLGEASLGTFIAGGGYTSFMKIAQQAPELLESISVLTDKGETLTPETFLDKLCKFKSVRIPE